MNTQLFLKINYWAGQNPWLDKFMIFSAEWLVYLMILYLVFLFFKNYRRYRDMVFVAFGSAIVSRFFFTVIIRHFYHHLRPFLVLQNAHLLIAPDYEQSFPSGHTAFLFALSTAIYFYNKKAGSVFLILSALVGFARVFVGVHWPRDIIGGAILGIGTAFLIEFIKEKPPIRAILSRLI